MSSKTTELKPCPFCGSGNVRYKEAEHAVVCARCKARGSIAPDEEMAIRMWDERAGELKPDSWEKLEEDANLGCRDYCEKHHLEECDYNMRVHMLDRAKKLAGIEEERGAYDEAQNPIREIRKAKTPPCTQCVHSRFTAFNSVTILCDSGAYLDHVERTCCERYDNFVAIDVRGTRWCRFEQKPPKAEDGDES